MKRNTIILISAVFAAACLFTSCKKNYDSSGQPTHGSNGTPTPVGTPAGNAVTKDIGSSGGNIVSDDGLLEVIVPAGAVAANTKFSIQPISNFCPGGLNSFRLSPDGMTFTSPVTLRFHYTDEDLEGSGAAFMGIAYQDKNNIWQQLTTPEIDSVNKMISIQTTHFTDWSIVQSLKIAAIGFGNTMPAIKVNQGLELQLIGNTDDDLPPLPNADGTPGQPLQEFLPFTARWYVNDVLNGNADVGEISISPGGDGKTVHYKAPARTPNPSVVTISAELTDFNGTWHAYFGKKKYTFNKVVLVKKIKILPDQMDYSFHYEQIMDEACSYAGTFQTDSVELEIHVKDGAVTTSNIVNHPPYITNPTVSIGGGCTMTTKAGTKGPVNITKGSGSVQPGVDDADNFTIDLTNSGATSTGCTYTCPNVTTPTDPITLTDAVMSFQFTLTDSVQSMGKKGQGVYWVLTPKH